MSERLAQSLLLGALILVSVKGVQGRTHRGSKKELGEEQ